MTCNFVGVDDERIGKMATEHLIQVGCKRIAHIRGPEISTGIGRVQGYRAALEAHHMKVRPEYIVSRDSSDTHADTSGYEAMKRLLQIAPVADGVVCYNDPTALGAIKAIFEAGLKIPRDVAVIGAGNDRYASELRVPLSTIDQQHHQLAGVPPNSCCGGSPPRSQSKRKRFSWFRNSIVRESTQRVSHGRELSFESL